MLGKLENTTGRVFRPEIERIYKSLIFGFYSTKEYITNWPIYSFVV